MKKFQEFELAEDENFAELFEESEKQTETNTVVDGVIVEMNSDSLLVDVGQKSEGKLNISEVTVNGKVAYRSVDLTRPHPRRNKAYTPGCTTQTRAY
jgi:small subunit ribosomal protein S1